MTTALSYVLSKLEGVKRDGEQHKALCPAHKDVNPSLSVSVGDNDSVLLHCHAGCTFEAILAAAELKASDLYDQEPDQARRETYYNYHDAEGKVIGRTVKVTVPKKDFWQERPNERGGWEKKYGSAGILYRLPEILAKPDRHVFICEGEKSADAVRGLGLLATTNALGAKKWKKEHTQTLRGRRVVILPDNDKAGQDHVLHVAAALFGRVKSVKIVPLPGLADGEDVFNWIERGGDKDKLVSLASSTAEYSPVRLVEAEPAPPEAVQLEPIKVWTLAELLTTDFPELRCIVDGLLPEGLTILAGKRKLGKSWMCSQLAATVASGGQFLGRECMAGPVLYLALEDSERRMSGRMKMQHTNDTSLPIELLFEWPTLDTGGLEALDRRIEAHQYALVIIDTLAAARSGKVDENSAEIAVMLNDLRRVAQHHGCAVVLVHHHRKGTGIVEDDPLDALRGSSAITAAADSVLSVFRKYGEREAKLAVVSRDLEEIELRIEFDAETTFCWSLLGDEKKLARSEAQQETLDLLAQLGEADAGTVASELGKSKEAARKVLNELCGLGLVTCRSERGSRGGRPKLLYKAIEQSRL